MERGLSKRKRYSNLQDAVDFIRWLHSGQLHGFRRMCYKCRENKLLVRNKKNGCPLYSQRTGSGRVLH